MRYDPIVFGSIVAVEWREGKMEAGEGGITA
jgi:hypothetical protein